uniref:Uncharacterized protein n=1 Tax=Oryza sativa subsp. japonica TaxID=39947 RepID=Q653A7_ORYSJ|nr:hypothetical protein [Oryza sativa Japonica Group]
MAAVLPSRAPASSRAATASQAPVDVPSEVERRLGPKPVVAAFSPPNCHRLPHGCRRSTATYHSRGACQRACYGGSGEPRTKVTGGLIHTNYLIID